MTFYVGIDIAKFKHDCFIADDQGCVVRDSFSFSNDLGGFNQLLSILNDLKFKGKIKIGFESTGHYHFNLKLFLETNGFDYVEFNPLLVHKFVTTQTLRRTKTDKKDSLMIAKYLMTVDYKPYPNTFYHINNLKSLCRLREILITDRTRFLNQITAYLDQIFPEFKPLLNHQLNKSALYILKHFMIPKKISRMSLEDYNEMACELKHPISYQKFSQIKALAQETIGYTSDGLEYALKTSLNTYLFISKQIELLEENITKIYQSLNYHIHTIRGVGVLTAAGIASEIGNFSRFSTPRQIQAFAGLEPSRSDSGIVVDKTGKMVKHGSSYLRKYLMNSAETFYVHNPVISNFYWKKRNEGKHHRVALSHVARKLVNIVFSLEKKNLDFNQHLLK